jgi:CHAT domain-containing protein
VKFQQAAEAWHSLGNSYEEALSFYGAGFSSSPLGENQIAIDYLTRALQMFTALKSISGMAMVKTRLGWPYLYLSDLESASDNFSQALQLQRLQGSDRGAGICLYGLGWVFAIRGKNQIALQRFEDSLVYRRRTMDRNGEAVTLAGIGKIQSRLGNYSAALKNLTLALGVLPANQLNPEADIRSNLGWVYVSLRDYEKAISFFESALAIRIKIEDLVGEATTRYGMSMAHYKSGRLFEAEQEIEAAVKIIESLRSKGSNQQLRLSYFASVQDYYDFYITLLLELDHLQPSAGYAAKALHACERARARGLLDLLGEAGVDLRQDIDPDLLERERTTSDKLSVIALRNQSSNGNIGSIDAVDKKTHHLRNELEAARSEIRKVNPGYAALTQIEPLTAAEIQKEFLDENTLLLQYVLGEKHSFLLAVSSNEITTHELPPRSEVEDLARRFHEASTLRNRPSAENLSRADATADDLALQLSRMLLRPIGNKLKKQRLVIVANGALQFIPFAALPKPSTTATLLIDDHELVVLPSVTALSAIRREARSRTPPSKSVIVLSDPVFDGSDGRVKNADARTPSVKYPRLIGSRWEGQQILSLVSPTEGKLVTDFDASRAFASSPELGRYRFVHFATHAIIDVEHPALSGILLSMVDSNGKSQDGFLAMEDIFKLKLPADLVVLSGCRTALGKDYAGEGLVGLTRAFIYAGASRIVVSLWQVADKPTSELMVRFYRHMLGPEKMTASAALRAAQLDLRKDPRWHAHYFWAPFILQGDWR